MRCTRALVGLALALAGVAVLAEQAPTVPASGRVAAADVVFFDDFDAPALNRASWNVIVTGRTVNNEQQAYIDSPETIALVRGVEAQEAANGALRIAARHRPGFKTPEGRTFDFTSGRIDTRGKVAFTYGTVSARITMTAGAGLWPAFWVLGDGRWPDTGEMDVMENVGAPDWINSALHGPGYSGNTPFAKRRSFPAGQDSAGWHVYTMDWSVDGFVFRVDDDAYYRVSRAEVEAKGRWAYRYAEAPHPRPRARGPVSAGREQDRRAVSGSGGCIG